jgi:acyl-coenzyme A synthetase/AMP-(fatty) acid ligase
LTLIKAARTLSFMLAPANPPNLAQCGIAKGLFSLLGRTPELYIAALGTLKHGSVFSPLFSAFGPEPIKARMSIGGAKALITSEAFYRRKVEQLRPGCTAARRATAKVAVF